MQRMRKTSINAAASGARIFVQLVVLFIVRTVFIRVLGMEMLGLDSLFVDVIQVLNVAELGIGVAMGYSMYKPAAEGDIEKLKSYDALFGKIFTVLAGIVVLLGLAMIPLFPFMVKGDVPNGINMYIVYAMFLTDTAVSYFAAHKRTLLFVYQQQFVNMLAMTAKYVLLGAAQLVILFAVKNYYFYAAVIPLSTLFECLIILFAAKKLHPRVRGRAAPLPIADKKLFVKNVSALSLHKLSGVIIIALDGILISRYFGWTMRAVFSNYQMIVFTLSILTGLLLQSVQASVGNMLSSAGREENYAVFRALNLGYWFLIGFMSIAFMCLVQPFLGLWLGAEKRFSAAIALAVAVRLFVGFLRGGIPNIYKDAAGLMQKDWWRALLEPALNIGLSLLFLHLFGLAGVFLGTIAAAALTCVWTESFVVYRYYFKKNVLFYYLWLLAFCAVSVVLGAAAYFACVRLPETYLFWVVRLLICLAISVAGYCLAFLPTRDFKSLVGLLGSTVRSVLKKSDSSNGDGVQ